MSEELIKLEDIAEEDAINKISVNDGSKEPTNQGNLRKLITKEKDKENHSKANNLTNNYKINSLISISNYYCSLDIGTGSVRCLIAESKQFNNDKTRLEVKGFGNCPSRGLRKGVVINIDSTVNSIKLAVKQAEEMAGHKINEVFLSISGIHIKSLNSLGVVAVRDKEISNYDIKKVIEAAKAIAIPPERELLHVIVQEYVVDGQRGIQQPLGMHGVRLEVNVHIVTGLISSSKNIVKCANKAGLKVKDIVFSSIATGVASLSASEKEQGVCLIDYGAGTTDISVYREGAVVFSEVIGKGSANITNLIAQKLKLSLIDAEKVKCKFGNACSSTVSKHETFLINFSPNMEQSRSTYDLSRVIESELKVLLNDIMSLLVANNLVDLIPGGFVVCGEGSNLKNLDLFFNDNVSLQVRTSNMTSIEGNNNLGTDATAGINNKYKTDIDNLSFTGISEICDSAEYATARGLLAYAASYSSEAKNKPVKGVKKLFRKAYGWISENF